MNCILLFHDIVLSFSKTNFSHEKPKHELQRRFQPFSAAKLGFVCFLPAAWYGPIWIQVGHKRYVCMYVHVAKYSVTIYTQLTFL